MPGHAAPALRSKDRATCFSAKDVLLGTFYRALAAGGSAFASNIGSARAYARCAARLQELCLKRPNQRTLAQLDRAVERAALLYIRAGANEGRAGRVLKLEMAECCARTASNKYYYTEAKRLFRELAHAGNEDEMAEARRRAREAFSESGRASEAVWRHMVARPEERSYVWFELQKFAAVRYLKAADYSEDHADRIALCGRALGLACEVPDKDVILIPDSSVICEVLGGALKRAVDPQHASAMRKQAILALLLPAERALSSLLEASFNGGTKEIAHGLHAVQELFGDGLWITSLAEREKLLQLLLINLRELDRLHMPPQPSHWNPTKNGHSHHNGSR